MVFLRQEDYLQSLENYIRKKDGNATARLLCFKDIHVQNARLALEYPDDIVQRFVSSPWDEIVAAHMRCMWCVNRDQYTDAYDCQTLLVQTFLKTFDNITGGKWCLPVMHAVVVDLRRFANWLDRRSMSQGRADKFGEFLEKAASQIMGLFRICTSDNRSSLAESKKWGMMGLCNQLFKVYFQINKLNLCKPMIRAIDNVALKDKFSMAQRVTYNYYVGRKSMFEDNFKAAETCLEFAFIHCLKTHQRNKRLILIYLIPVKMLLGIFPRPDILQKYNLLQFSGIVEAVKVGDVRRLNEEMEQNEAFFIKCGIYLILEKLKTITYRNLFKKVYLILNTNMLPIGAFMEALKLMGVDDIDIAETQCILANLIYENKIKGYLAHQQEKLVVSKKQAFP